MFSGKARETQCQIFVLDLFSICAVEHSGKVESSHAPSTQARPNKVAKERELSGGASGGETLCPISAVINDVGHGEAGTYFKETQNIHLFWQSHDNEHSDDPRH